MVMANNKIDGNKKFTSNAGDFNCHADVAVQCGVHHPMEHIPGFIRSNWMLPLGKCLRRIALAAAMFDEFVETIQNTNKTQLLGSNYSTFRLLVVYENFVPKMDPLPSSLMQQALFKCETPQLELKSL